MVASYLLVIDQPPPAGEKLSTLERAAYVPRFVNLGRSSARQYRSGFLVEIRGPSALDQLSEESIHELGIPKQKIHRYSFFALHAMGEAAPSPSRYISLSRESRDDLGRPVPIIHWKWTLEDRKMAKDMHETILAAAECLAPKCGRLIPIRDPLVPGGIAHEAGTCRMGLNPNDSVTDGYGAVHGASGLFLADASVMPTALDRYPTFTLAALVLRTADRIIGEFKDGKL
jgi:choline dehydrogenase-like flavoprotein